MNLQQMLDKIGEAGADDDEVSLDTILEAVGRRSFGPLLLVTGLLTLSPIGAVPGVPTIMGIVVFLVAIQLLFQRQYFWLPRFLLERSVEREKLRKALDWLRSPARWIDRLLRPRLPLFTEGAATYVIALVGIGIAAMMPVMELVPFSAYGAGIALTAFGLALIAHDGLLALIAFVVTVITAGLIVYSMF